MIHSSCEKNERWLVYSCIHGANQEQSETPPSDRDFDDKWSLRGETIPGEKSSFNGWSDGLWRHWRRETQDAFV
jgi:hypothetical protein